jgi:hypothetical protein
MDEDRVMTFLAGYHRTVAPIQFLDIYSNIRLAIPQRERHSLLWTERTSGIAINLTRRMPKPQPVQHIEL